MKLVEWNQINIIPVNWAIEFAEMKHCWMKAKEERRPAGWRGRNENLLNGMKISLNGAGC